MLVGVPADLRPVHAQLPEWGSHLQLSAQLKSCGCLWLKQYRLPNLAWLPADVANTSEQYNMEPGFARTLAPIINSCGSGACFPCIHAASPPCNRLFQPSQDFQGLLGGTFRDDGDTETGGFGSLGVQRILNRYGNDANANRFLVWEAFVIGGSIACVLVGALDSVILKQLFLSRARKHKRYSPFRSTTAVDVNTNGKPVKENERLVRGKTKRDAVTVEFTQADLGEGAARAVLVHDDVCLGTEFGQQICTNLDIMAAVNMDDELFDAMPYDGMLGLSLAGLSTGTGCVFFQRLMETNPSMLPQFGLSFGAQSGEIYFGGHNSGRLAEDLKWFPVLHPEDGFWEVAIQSVRLGNAYLLGLGIQGQEASFRLEEPLHWKGGTLHAIWKQKGCQTSCDSYRAILVSSAVGKTFHGALRSKCSSFLDSATTPLQIGGRQGQPVVVAAQAVRAFQTAARAAKKCFAVLFLDLREAFHRVVRPLIHGGDLSDMHIASVVKELGLHPSSVDRLHAFVTARSLLQQAGSSDWTASILRETSADSWFSFGSSPKIAAVHSGTRPGDNLADLLFTFLFAEVSKVIRDKLRQAGLRVDLPWNPDWFLRGFDDTSHSTETISPLDVTWMDDLAVLLWADGPDRLIHALRTAATVTIDSCIQALLLPNLRAGKTEAIAHLVGAGSKRVRLAVFNCKEPTLDLSESIWPGARLRLVSSYRHLGGILHVTGSLAYEIRARTGAAWHAFRKHKRQVFGSPTVGARDKAVLFGSLVESTLFFGIGAWPRVTSCDTQKIQSTLVAMARNMLRPRYSLDQACHLSALFVLSTARVLSADSAFHVERLRYFGLVAVRASPDLWAILRFEKHWILHVQESLEWLRDKLDLRAAPALEIADWDAAVAFIRLRPPSWKRLVTNGRRTALLLEAWEAEVQQYHGMTYRALVEHGAVVPSDLRSDTNSTEVCGLCSCVFPGLREWSHHAFKRHGRCKPTRSLVTGSQCPVCLKNYACNARLCQHLDYTTSCRWALRNSGVYHDPEPGTGSRKFDNGRSQLQPSAQAYGPGRVWNFSVGKEEWEEPSKEVLDRLEDLFIEGELATADLPDLVRKYKACYCVCCLQQSRLRATAEKWQCELSDLLAADEDVSVQWSSWHSSVARFVTAVDFAQWLCDDISVPQASTATFQQAALKLPWLDFQDFCLPSACTFDACGIGIFPDTPVRAAGLFARVLRHTACFQDGDLLRFGRRIEEFRRGITVLSCQGLLNSLSTPRPLRHYGDIAGPLQQLRLFSDLVRGTIFLWGQGLPAALLLPRIVCPAVDAVVRSSPFRYHSGELTLTSNVAIPDDLFACLTS
ncbi:Pgc [Symbiodinium sp. CCMP2592]|nr:Pgc [Symbiodinium sp. CCMP2592]